VHLSLYNTSSSLVNFNMLIDHYLADFVIFLLNRGKEMIGLGTGVAS